MANIAIRAGDAPELEAYLTERIYEYNAAATGYHDAELFSAARATESGVVEAGISGHLSSHSFQAPEFYARLGYKPVARVDDYPVGHSDVFYAKCLDTT